MTARHTHIMWRPKFAKCPPDIYPRVSLGGLPHTSDAVVFLSALWCSASTSTSSSPLGLCGPENSLLPPLCHLCMIAYTLYGLIEDSSLGWSWVAHFESPPTPAVLTPALSLSFFSFTRSLVRSFALCFSFCGHACKFKPHGIMPWFSFF